MTDYNFRNKVRAGVRVSLFIFLLLQIACISSGATDSATEMDCKQLLSQESILKMGKAKIRKIQQDLDETGYHPKEIDGVIGPNTKAALQQFCIDFAGQFRKDSPDDFIATINLYAAIAADFPQWREILFNDDFGSWINQQPAEKRAEFQIIMRTGTAGDIISLFKKYQSEHEKRAEEGSKGEFERSDKYVVSYKLTQSDLEQLSAKNDIAGKLEKLKDKSFAGKDEFLNALQRAVAPQTYELDQYQNLIIDLALAQNTYTLTGTSLIALKEENLPNSVLKDLQKLQDIEFANQNEFAAALQPIIDKVRDEFNQYQDLILEVAEVPRTYTLTEKSLKVLKEKDLPDNLLAELEKLKDKTYEDQAEFIRAVQPVIEDVTIGYNFSKPTLTELSNLQTERLAEQRTEAKKIITEVKKKYDEYQMLILQQVQILPGYRLTNQTYKKLTAAGVPDYINNMLHSSRSNDFSNETQFKVALNAKIDALISKYRLQIEKYAEKQEIYKLTGLSLNKLRQELKKKEIPDAIIKILQDNMLDVEYPNAYFFRKALQENIKAFAADSLNFENKITGIARKDHPIDVKPNSVKWSGNDCGCVLDELTESVVYGFYPFWMSKNEPAEPQKDESGNGKKIVPQLLDFSVISRIGYYALPVNNQGSLEQDNIWDIKEKAGFIKTAQKYQTKVDLVIYKVNWSDWCKTGDIEKFSNAVVDLLKYKQSSLSDWIKFVLTTLPWKWVKSYNRIGAVADGITINFDGYPSDPDSKKKFLELITTLKIKLSEAGKDFNLNLMVPRAAVGVDVFEYEDLKKILSTNDENENLKVVLLVLLDEPTTQSKKALREDIEKNYQGQDRMKILRRIVPVITYEGHNEKQKKQLFDDVLYGKENFGGIGFWSLPVGKSKQAQDISTAVKNVFSPQYKEMGVIKRTISQTCNFICPNRWLFRTSLDILILVLALFGFLYLFSCKFRNFYNSSSRFFWILMGVLLLFIGIGLSLLYCDPYYKNLREGNWPLFIVIAVIIGMTVRQYFKRLRMARNP